jgi:hypothetical protein
MKARTKTALTMLCVALTVAGKEVDESEGWGRGPYEQLGNFLEDVKKELERLGIK